MDGTTPLELLQQARGVVPTELVGPRGWSHLEVAARSMPVGSHSIFLECHLSDEGGRTDLIARYLPEDRERLLAKENASALFAWEFLSRWADPSSPLHSISFVDIEWDVGEQGVFPFVCPTLEPILTASPSALEALRQEDAAQQRPHRARMLARQVLHALYGEAIPRALYTRLEEAFDGLPAYSSIHNVNYLAGRHGRAEEAALRAIVSLPQRALCEYLRLLRFPEEPDWVLARLRRYRPFSTWVNIDVDLGTEGLTPRIGIYSEFSKPRPTDRTLAELLGKFEGDGLVRPECLAALRAWVQRPQPSLTFKVVANPNRALALKAYLEIGPYA